MSLHVLAQCMLAVLLVCATKLCVCRALHARALLVSRDKVSEPLALQLRALCSSALDALALLLFSTLLVALHAPASSLCCVSVIVGPGLKRWSIDL